MKALNLLVRIYLLLTLSFLLGQVCFAVEFDSIDDEINAKYNAKELEITLPKLPQNLEPNNVQNNNSKVTPQNAKPTVITKTMPYAGSTFDKSTTPHIKRGTKVRAVSQNWASDSANAGNKISFTTTKPIVGKFISIPANSTLKGRIVSAHLPQFGGNGGLIKIEIENVIIDGATHYADGKITKANGKHIYLNNIKGERQYAKAVKTQIGKSHKFFQKAMKKTSVFASDGATVILSPFTFLGGTLVWAGGVATSPIIGLKSKGKRISLPPNTLYEIKFTKDVYIWK